MQRRLLALSPVLAGTLGLTACEQLESGESVVPLPSAESPDSDESEVSVGGDPSLRMSRQAILDMYSDASCDALSGVTAQVSSLYNRGLRGVVSVPRAGVAANDHNFGALTSFTTATSVSLANKLYFSQVNVPTRSFSSGFPRLDGGKIKDDSNRDLLEYFRLDLDGFIELAPGMTAGDYEFAVLADDGAEIRLGAGSPVYASSPGLQQTTLVCGTSSVYMRPGETLPMKLSYFQGPRYHIALMLLWRPASTTAESLCGRSGNDLWFDSAQAPKPKYLELQSRGWNVVPTPSFRLPDEELLNPCQSDHVRDVVEESCQDSSCGGVGI